VTQIGWRRRAGLAGAPVLARLALLAPLALLTSCDLAPRYQPPAPILPASYHGSGPFVVAQPQDQAPRGPWWRIFADPVLDRLERQVDANNPTLAAAAEAYTQARDIVGEARAGLYPQLGTQALLSEDKQSDHRLFRSGESGPNIEPSNQIDATLSWEPDFWWSIRNETKSAKAAAQAAAAQLASARLALETELADDYLAMRGLDAQHAVYLQTIASYKTAVQITQLRLSGKIASGLDVQRAQDQLASAQALDTDTLALRAVLAHAIAALTGVVPGTLDLAPAAVDSAALTVPAIPVGVPSALLQRRPDIAEAERLMAAANAQIGVARAAFYPNITLNAVSGFQDTGFNLVSLPNSLWAIGAQAALPLFEGGLRRAELQQSWSKLAQASDIYRATVLNAFQQVEDGLVLTDRLGAEAAQQQDAVTAAQRAQSMSLTLYTGGISDYIEVTVAQIAALSAEIAEAEVTTRRLQAVVGLVTALGGGWSDADLPTPDQTLPFDPLNPRPRPDEVVASRAIQ
jgi:NodT family efflux transporter outer membrane factor (OMF) lipoprotein